MKKIVLAISGIFCLQLAFIGFNLGDPAAEQSFVRMDEEATGTLAAAAVESPLGDEVATADFDDSVLDRDPTAPVDSRSAARRIVPQPAESAVVRRARRPVRSTFVESETAIRPVKIEYKTYDAVAFRPQTAPRVMRTEFPRAVEPTWEGRDFQTSAKNAPRKKKGFFAKSLTIIKKPYDWLKTVGSALK